MPVTIKPSEHGANLIKIDPDSLATSAADVLLDIVRKNAKAPHDQDESVKGIEDFQERLKIRRNNQARAKARLEESIAQLELFQSSVDPKKSLNFQTVDHGFLSACILAYSNHHHLTIKPEDIWFAILVQFNFFVNAHAEELRSKFVNHEGQKSLVLQYAAGGRYSFDFGIFAKDMSLILEKNIRDASLREWIMPDFSTTGRNDTIIASIMMMSTLQKYFTFHCVMTCGLPSVTLEGERSDYQLILDRLDKLQEFGDEPTQFASLLRPVIRRFISSFDDPTAPDIIQFWQQIYSRHHQGSGETYCSGWLTAFAFWDDDGKCQYWKPRHVEGIESSVQYLQLDDAVYSRITEGGFPTGWCKVPVKLNDNGQMIDAWMISGSVGLNYEESPQATGFDSIRPETGWFMFTGGFIQGA